MSRSLSTLSAGKSRVKDNLRQPVQRQIEIMLRQLYEVRGRFFIGPAVPVPAAMCDGIGHGFFRGPLFRAVEDHVLDEVRDAVVDACLVA